MRVHANAPLGPKGRLTMVRRVFDERWSFTDAAAAAGAANSTLSHKPPIAWLKARNNLAGSYIQRITAATSAPVQSSSATTNSTRGKRPVVASRPRSWDLASVFISSPFSRLSPHSASRGLREQSVHLVCPSHPWKPLVCSLAASRG